MIELLLQAESALDEGRLEQAERAFRQLVASDPGNAMAVAGLARVALARTDLEDARLLASRALSLDPDNVAAHKVLGALERAGAGAEIEADSAAVADRFAAAEAAAAIEAIDEVGDVEQEAEPDSPAATGAATEAPGPGETGEPGETKGASAGPDAAIRWEGDAGRPAAASSTGRSRLRRLLGR